MAAGAISEEDVDLIIMQDAIKRNMVCSIVVADVFLLQCVGDSEMELVLIVEGGERKENDGKSGDSIDAEMRARGSKIFGDANQSQRK